MLFRVVVPLIVTAALLGLGYSYGKISAAKKYEPQLAALRATIDHAEQTAKAQYARNKETQNAISKQNSSNIAAIRARYERMLQHGAASGASPVAASTSSGRVDATGGEQAIAGCSAEFEQACILDANKVTQWQDWAMRNQIPISTQ